MLAFWVLCILARPTTILMGYDCGGSSLNITTICLLDIRECQPPVERPNVTTTYLQLLQKSEYSEINVISCRMEIDRNIQHCGMHSHVSAVQRGRRRYLVDLDQGACSHLHNTHSFVYGHTTPMVNLQPNATNYRTLTLVETIGVDGTCNGAQFSDPYGTWSNVIVEAFIYITFRSYGAMAKPAKDAIILKTGVHCKISDLSCLDDDGSNVYWSPLPEDEYQFHSYDVLYQGPANKIYDSGSRYPVIYSVTTEETTFARSQKSERSLCGYILIQTEHPKLMMVETNKDRPFAKK